MSLAVNARDPSSTAGSAARPWLNRRRIGVYAAALTALYAALLGASAFRGLWFVDQAGRGIANDFIAFWSAGRLALEGHAGAAYDPAALKAVEALGLGQEFAGNHPWLYSPIFLLLVAPFALAPFLPALFLWLGVTLAAYLRAARAIVPHGTAALAALALPAVCFNVIAGQNGLLTAALLGGALALLESQPLAAGVLFGLLAFKPQFGPLIPLVLVATGRWRATFAAALTVAALAALSLTLFGRESWDGFLAAEGRAADQLLIGGGLGLFKLQSVFGVLRLMGVEAGAAAIGQGLAALAAIVVVVRLWRGPSPYPLKAAALAAGVLVVTPYVLVYDLTLLGVAIAFLVRDCLGRGFLAGEKPALIGAALLPLLYLAVPGPVGLAAEAMIAALIVRRVSAGSAGRRFAPPPITGGCAGSP